MVLVLGLFVAYTAMKLIPMYLEYNALGSALKTVQNDPLAAEQSAGKIRKRILNSLWVSYASNNIKSHHISIKRSQGIHIRVVYEVRKPWIGNIDLIAHFDKSVSLRK
jgi:hypothetical protein